VQEQDRPLDPAAEIVAEEGVEPQIPLALEEDVVHGVVHVDQETAGDQPGGERGRAGGAVRGGAGCRGGDEVPAGAHLRCSPLCRVHAAARE
jgi:hypothetical protein